jgi:hypothetical protein
MTAIFLKWIVIFKYRYIVMEDQSIIIILGIGTGFLGLMLRYAFKSKCDRVSCCFGLMAIHREVEQEDRDIERAENSQRITL